MNYKVIGLLLFFSIANVKAEVATLSSEAYLTSGKKTKEDGTTDFGGAYSDFVYTPGDCPESTCLGFLNLPPVTNADCPVGLTKIPYQGVTTCALDAVEQQSGSFKHVITSIVNYKTQMKDYTDADSPQKTGGSHMMIRKMQELVEEEGHRYVKNKVTLAVNPQTDNQRYRSCAVEVTASDLEGFIRFVPHGDVDGECEGDNSQTGATLAGNGVKTPSRLMDCPSYMAAGALDPKVQSQAEEAVGRSGLFEAVLDSTTAAKFRSEGSCDYRGYNANGVLTTMTHKGYTERECLGFCNDLTDKDEAACGTASKTWVLPRHIDDIYGECSSGDAAHDTRRKCEAASETWHMSKCVGGSNNGQYVDSSTCVTNGGEPQTISTWTDDLEYSCEYYIANNMFLGTATLVVTFDKASETIVASGGDPTTAIKIPLKFVPGANDPSFHAATRMGILDNAFQNSAFRDAKIAYSHHCEDPGGYEQLLEETQCIGEKAWKTCPSTGRGGHSAECTKALVGTVSMKLTASFLDRRYKIISQSGAETLTPGIGDFLLLKQGLELHNDYKSFNDASKDEFSKGGDNTVNLQPVAFRYRKLIPKCGENEVACLALKWTFNDGNLDWDNKGVELDAEGNPQRQMYKAPVINDGYHATELTDSDIEFTYRCNRGAGIEGSDYTLTSNSRGNCFAQYVLNYVFDFKYGDLPHFLPGYIGCEICSNELAIKGFKEDTDGDGNKDTYQVNTKIPIDVSKLPSADNQIIMNSVDFAPQSPQILLEPNLWYKMSTFFALSLDERNTLKTRIGTAGVEAAQDIPTDLDDIFNWQEYFAFTSRNKQDDADTPDQINMVTNPHVDGQGCSILSETPLYELSSDTITGLNDIFQKNCYIKVPKNEFGATYTIEFDNLQESTLGSCTITNPDPTDGTCADPTAGCDQNIQACEVSCGSTWTPRDAVVVKEKIMAMQCVLGSFYQKVVWNKADCQDPLDPNIYACPGVSTFTHVLDVDPLDEAQTVVIKETDSRKIMLGSTELTLFTREIASVFRVATTIQMRITKELPVPYTQDRIIFRLHGADGSFAGFTETGDECVSGPVGTCSGYDVSIRDFATEAGGTSGEDQTGVERTACVAASGTFTGPTVNTIGGLHWTDHFDRQYLNADGTPYVDGDGNALVPQGICTSESLLLNGLSTTYAECHAVTGSKWVITSIPDMAKLSVAAKITDCQPQAGVTNGGAIQEEVMFTSSAVNGESVEQVIRSTDACTGTLDFQLEDTTLYQEFAIYKARIACSRVSTADLVDRVDLLFKFDTSLDLASNILDIRADYADAVMTDGECESDALVTDPVSCKGKCDEGAGLETSKTYAECEVDGVSGNMEDDFTDLWAKTYTVQAYFGHCNADNTIARQAGTDTTQGELMINQVLYDTRCKNTNYRFIDQGVGASPVSEFKLQLVEGGGSTIKNVENGLEALMDCANVVYHEQECDKPNHQFLPAEYEQKCGECGQCQLTNGGTPVTEEMCSDDYGMTKCTSSKVACLSAGNQNGEGATTWLSTSSTTREDCGIANQHWSEDYYTPEYVDPTTVTDGDNYIITYSLAMQYTRKVHNEAFNNGNVKMNTDYCDDQTFTATLRRDATASVTTSQIKAAGLDRAVMVKDIGWIGNAVTGTDCGVGLYQLEILLASMDADSRDPSWNPSLLNGAFMDTASSARNPNNMVIHEVAGSTIIRDPSDLAIATDGGVADAAGTTHSVFVDNTYANGGSDQNHFKVRGACIRIDSCTLDTGVAEQNGDSWSDFSEEMTIDMVIRGVFLNADVDTKLAVTINFQECPIQETASVTGTVRLGLQLECTDPQEVRDSAGQYRMKLADQTPQGDAGKSPTGSPNTYDPTKGCYVCDTEVPLYYGSSTTWESGSEKIVTADNLGFDKRVCCPQDCTMAYADDVAMITGRIYVTSTQNDPLDFDAFMTAGPKDEINNPYGQSWSPESLDVYLDRYDTSGDEPRLKSTTHLCECLKDATKCTVVSTAVAGISEEFTNNMNLAVGGTPLHYQACGYHTTQADGSDGLPTDKTNANLDGSAQREAGDFLKHQINLMPLSFAPADEFRVRYDAVLKTGLVYRRRLRTTQVLRAGEGPRGASGESKGVRVIQRDSNTSVPVAPAGDDHDDDDHHDGLELGEVLAIIGGSVAGLGFFAWGIYVCMKQQRKSDSDEVLRLIGSGGRRQARFSNLRY